MVWRRSLISRSSPESCAIQRIAWPGSVMWSPLEAKTITGERRLRIESGAPSSSTTSSHARRLPMKRLSAIQRISSRFIRKRPLHHPSKSRTRLASVSTRA